MKVETKVKMDWQEQFLMMKRWYYRLRGDNDIFGKPVSYKEDFFLAFFVSTHHLKDWLKKGGVGNKAEIQTFIKNNPCLELAGAIANLSKHVELDHPRWEEYKNTKIAGQKYLVSVGSGPTFIESRLKIEFNGKTYHDIFPIVEMCMGAWGRFLISKKLEIPTMPEEFIFERFVVWQPESEPLD